MSQLNKKENVWTALIGFIVGTVCGLSIGLSMVKETKSTESGKLEFIKEIKTGLGSEIKEKGGRVTIIKKTRYEKFMIWVKKIFTKF